MVDYVKNKAKTVANKDLYSDLNLKFIPHPITGDVTRLTDTDAIRRSVRNIVSTNYYERPFKPSLGGNIRNMLFNLDDDESISKASKKIKEVIETFEPRVNNVFCRVNNQRGTNTLNLTIFYNIVNGVSNQKVDLTLSRAR